jgi:hypothetical protein
VVTDVYHVLQHAIIQHFATNSVIFMGFVMNLWVNSDYFSERHLPAGICGGDAMRHELHSLGDPDIVANIDISSGNRTRSMKPVTRHIIDMKQTGI